MEPKILAIYSPSPGSGKTTFSNFLIQGFGRECGVGVLSFASPLKAMVATLLRKIPDLSEKDIFEYLHDKKEEVIPILGCSVRRLLQTLGTEWGRQVINPYIWINLLEREVERLKNNLDVIIIDDMRFLNEFNAVRKMGGKTIYLDRKINYETDHVSEGQLDSFKESFDYIVENSGSLEELRQIAFEIVNLEKNGILGGVFDFEETQSNG
jgi:hypothetical protein